MNRLYVFKFDKTISDAVVDRLITMSIAAAEQVFGKTKIRLAVTYSVLDNQAVLKVSDDVGQHIVESFTRRVEEEFGEDKFTVRQVS